MPTVPIEVARRILAKAEELFPNFPEDLVILKDYYSWKKKERGDDAQVKPSYPLPALAPLDWTLRYAIKPQKSPSEYTWNDVYFEMQGHANDVAQRINTEMDLSQEHKLRGNAFGVHVSGFPYRRVKEFEVRFSLPVDIQLR